MEIESFDCDDFERRAGCIPCESMIAGKISSFKDRPMSKDLFDMDQREYVIIKNEEADLQAVREKQWNLAQKPAIINTLMVLVASIVGFVASSHFENPALFILSGAAGLISGAFLIGFAIAEITGIVSIPERDKIRDIDDNRMARLQNKVSVLEGKMANANDEYSVAKDFFRTKYELYLGQRNRPINNVSQILYHTTLKKA